MSDFSVHFTLFEDNENDLVGQTLQTYQCGMFVPSMLGPMHIQKEMGNSLLVTHKTITKPSTFVKFVIKFEGATNPTHNLILCSLYNCNWQG